MKTLRLSLEIGWLCCLFFASASAAEPLFISFPELLPVGFSGSEIAVDARIENRGDAAVEAKFSTRLWQMSSATLVPLSEAQAWWSGRVEAGKSVDVIAKIALPECKAATRFRLQVLAADGTLAAKVDATAIPRDWLRGQFATLAAPPALYDPAERIAPAFAKLGIETAAVRATNDLANLRAPVAIVVSPKDQTQSLAAAERLAARGVGVVFIDEVETAEKGAMVRGVLAPGVDLAESASAQFRLAQWLREALKRKQTQNTTNP